MSLAGLKKTARRNVEDERSQMLASQIVPEWKGATMTSHGDAFLDWCVEMVAAVAVG